MNASQLSDDTLATVLLCGGLAPGNGAAPLTQKEWNDFVKMLVRANWRPGDLPRWGMQAAREALALDDAMASRLEALLGQAVSAAIELERLVGAGIGVLSRADEAYPSRWRSRLREHSPPLVFIAGPKALLERGGVAAVGSREVDESGTAFARALGGVSARAQTPMISGGARGVDREAMFGALEAGGEAIGIMPDGLSRALRSPDVRRWVAEGHLALLSPHRPGSRFEVWKAMARNKLIYALADIAVVISSDEGRGGTWSGATENLRNDWTPLFVRTGTGIPAGNRRLLELGALPIEERELQELSPRELIASLASRAERQSNDPASHPVQQPLVNGAEARATRSSKALRVNHHEEDGIRASGSQSGQLGLF